jgi:hypothetical protein
MKSGNLNFLEPSGPLQACNRTALPFYIYMTPIEENPVVRGLYCMRARQKSTSSIPQIREYDIEGI